MSCEKIRSDIEMAFASGRPDLGIELESHLRDCPECSAYRAELYQLRMTLNAQAFSVLPGELDDITFEKIAGEKTRSGVDSRSKRPALKSAARWVWAPAAAAAIAFMLFFFPDRGDLIIEPETTGSGSSDWVISLESDIPDSVVWSGVVDRFLGDETEFDLAADEIPLELEEALESMTEEELRLLYMRIDQLNGSAS